jgi:tRNA-dihydrouridine synthase A
MPETYNLTDEDSVDMQHHYSNFGKVEEENQQKELHLAPMMHVTTREFRALFRILSKRLVLWTEMVVDEALHHTVNPETGLPPEHILDRCNSDSYNYYYYENNIDDDKQQQQQQQQQLVEDYPIVCQIGGIRPDWTSTAARSVLLAGYREVNLNMGCPSLRVKTKEFGAALMKDTERSIDIIKAIIAQQQQEEDNHCINISVKCRIGVDDESSWEWLVDFIEQMSVVCTRFIIHARVAILNRRFSAAQNRSVPPLNYPFVYRLCERFPHLTFYINGGIPNLQVAKEIAYGTTLKYHQSSPSCLCFDLSHAVPCQLCSSINGSCTVPPMVAPQNLRGCMLGRAAMEDPAQFWDVDRYFYDEPQNPVPNRRQALQQYCDFLDRLYPRRCCDDHPEATYRIPSPSIVHTRPYCCVCAMLRDPQFRANHNLKHQLLTVLRNHPEKSDTGIDNDDNTTTVMVSEPPTVKMKYKVLGRAMKPFLGMFHGMPGGRQVRRVADELCQNADWRNCGPSFLLQAAVIIAIPDEVLDRPFVKTEDRKWKHC